MISSIQTIQNKLNRSLFSPWSVFPVFLFLAFLPAKAPAESASDLSRTHALLINGGGSRRINYQSHLLHVVSFYRILSEAGVPASNISILSADGSDSEPDLATREMQKEADFWMLSGTRLEKSLRPRIRYVNSEFKSTEMQPATRESLRQWFESAEGELVSGDTLIIYVTDHGTLNEEDPTNNQITLWGEEEKTGKLIRHVGKHWR